MERHERDTMDGGSEGWVEDRKEPHRYAEDSKQSSTGAASPLFGRKDRDTTQQTTTTVSTRDYANEAYENLLEDDEKYPD